MMCRIFNCCLNALNFFWLSKMASGAMKVRHAGSSGLSGSLEESQHVAVEEHEYPASYRRYCASCVT